MEKLHFSIQINASKQRVWDTMLNDATYREWTEIFNPSSGSYYEGDWSEGSHIKFLGPDKDGTVSGMYSLIKENRPYEFLSIQHLGEIIKDEVKPWPGDGSISFFENYTFKEEDGSTTLEIDVDANDDFKAMFEEMWPKALEKLKELSEAN